MTSATARARVRAPAADDPLPPVRGSGKASQPGSGAPGMPTVVSGRCEGGTRAYVTAGSLSANTRRARAAVTRGCGTTAARQLSHTDQADLTRQSRATPYAYASARPLNGQPGSIGFAATKIRDQALNIPDNFPISFFSVKLSLRLTIWNPARLADISD
jgi:hypothetical protein